MRMLKLFYLLALLSPCLAGFIVPSVRKAIARGHGFPQINKNNQQQHHARVWYHQLIDMNSSSGLKRGDIGSLPHRDVFLKRNYKPHYDTHSSAMHGSGQYYPQKLHSPKASVLRSGPSPPPVHQRNDRNFGSYHHNNILDKSHGQTANNKMASYSTSSSPLSSFPNSSHNTAPVGVLKACKSEI